jgi:VIT1/CCC1 family predicted Fe2+/Mn2+ transporter
MSQEWTFSKASGEDHMNTKLTEAIPHFGLAAGFTGAMVGSVLVGILTDLTGKHYLWKIVATVSSILTIFVVGRMSGRLRRNNS